MIGLHNEHMKIVKDTTEDRQTQDKHLFVSLVFHCAVDICDDANPWPWWENSDWGNSHVAYHRDYDQH